MTMSTIRWRLLETGRNGVAVAASLFLLLTCSLSLVGGTTGKVVAIGGQSADLALDEARGVVYVANFTANRIDVVSASNGSVQSSMNVSAQPVSVALSPDGRYLTTNSTTRSRPAALRGQAPCLECPVWDACPC